MRTLYRGGRVYSTARPVRDRAAVRRRHRRLAGLRRGGRRARRGGRRGRRARGALVTPAFVDAHVHVTETGLALRRPRPALGALGRARSSTAVEAAARTGRGRPVLGHGWDERDLAEGRPPTGAELDRASAGGVGLPGPGGRRTRRSSPARSPRPPASRDLAGWTRRRPGRARRPPRRPLGHPCRAVPGGARGRPAGRAARGRGRAGSGACTRCPPRTSRPRGTSRRWSRSPARTPRSRCPRSSPYRGRAGRRPRRGARSSRLGVPVAGLAGDLNADGAVGLADGRLPRAVRRRPDTRGHAYLDRRAGPRPRRRLHRGRAPGRLPRRSATPRSTPSSRGSGAPPSAPASPPSGAAGHRLEHVEMRGRRRRRPRWPTSGSPRACSRRSTPPGAGATGCTPPASAPSGRRA